MTLRHGSLFCVLLLSSLFFAPMARAQEITVSAAISLTNALREVGASFEAAHPGLRVTFNFGASGALLRQIEAGAPVDVFAPADQDSMDRAQANGLIVADTRRDFCRNALVLAVPSASSPGLDTLSDLALPRVVRIALADPSFVPAGRYARQSLTAAGLFDALTPKLILGANVRQVLNYLVRGEVDAGFVYATDALSRKDTVKILLVAQGHDPISYPAALLADSAHPREGREFLAFLQSDAGKSILRKHGFLAP